MAQTTATGLPTIGDVVLAWRKFRGLRSTELVQKAGIKKGYLSALEHNKRATPQEVYLAKLADALDVPLQEIYGRRMPPKDGTVVTTPSSKQRIAGQETYQVSADEAEEEEKLDSMVNAALGIPDSLLVTTGEEVDAMIVSARLSKEEYEQVDAAVKEMTRRLLSLIETERKMRRKDSQ